MNEIVVFRRARRNPVAKSLRAPEFRQRVVPAFKQYSRSKQKRDWRMFLD